MDIAAFKISHSVEIDIDTTALRAVRARSSSMGAMERYTWVRFAGNWRKCRRGFKRRALCTEAYPPVMFNPISSAVPPDCMLKTRLTPMALSTTAPGTSASMVRARSMQTAELELHTLLVSSYVPAASKILLTELSAIAAVNSPTVLADTSFRCRPCSAT
jgi:hypothetical protein